MDTNAVIELLGGTLPISGNRFLQNIIDQNAHHLSVINQIELLGYNGSVSQMRPIEDFISISNILPLSDAVVANTINLRKMHKIKLPDAIIAATALAYNLTLISRNTSDFQKIDKLKCINPHKV